jgi:hypothetical protein
VTETGEQTIGQLMGSVVSFPVLCIVVGTAVRMAVEYDQSRRLTLRDTPACINGDDNLAKCTAGGYAAWRRVSRAFGLEESVGKSYWSKEFMEINSTAFTYNRDSTNAFITVRADGKLCERQQPYGRVKYVNMGLLFGLKRSGGGVSLNDQGTEANIGARYRALLEQTPENLRLDVHERFISNHQEMLKAVHPIPWNAPTWIGGLGMTGVMPLGELDLRVAKSILLNWRERQPEDLGAIRDVPWKIWKLAESRLPKPDHTQEKDSNGEKVYLDAMAKQCVGLLFDSSVTLESIHPDPEIGGVLSKQERNIRRAININRRIWNPSRYTKGGKGLPNPMDPAELVFRARNPTYLRRTTITYQPSLKYRPVVHIDAGSLKTKEHDEQTQQGPQNPAQSELQRAVAEIFRETTKAHNESGKARARNSLEL